MKYLHIALVYVNHIIVEQEHFLYDSKINFIYTAGSASLNDSFIYSGFHYGQGDITTQCTINIIVAACYLTCDDCYADGTEEENNYATCKEGFYNIEI